MTDAFRSGDAGASPHAGTTGAGPLAGLRVVEFAGLGPAPFAAMMLADQGATVVRVARKGGGAPGELFDLLARGRRSLGLDLKQPAAIDVVRRLIAQSDAVIEGFRPGVMERLGLGPDDCLAANPRLVYGRATGWGQSGPLAQAAGHDINYIALSGTLHCVGPAGGPPTPVPGFIGDFGGGGMLLAFGMVTAMLAAARTGRGQVVDAAVSDGATLLATLNYGWRHHDQWQDEAGVNMGDGGAPFFNTYRCRDGKDIAVGAIEPQFYAELRRLCGLSDPCFDRQWDRRRWPEQKAALAKVFATRTRDAWCALLEGTDACFAPVLGLDEAPAHPHHRARGTFVTVDGITQPAPAPRFSGTPSAAPGGVADAGADTIAVLTDLGLDAASIDALLSSGAAWAG